MKIPVVISHFNSAPYYLKYALESAAKFEQEVVFIGDNKNCHVWSNSWDSQLIESKKYKEFRDVYIKMSDYSENYEDGFWKRMFLLEDWMNIQGADKVILLDSDIISFVNYAKDVYPLLPKKCYSALVIAKESGDYIWAASTHCSYWTIDGIRDFTNFCINTYANKNDVMNKLRNKYRWHLEEGISGGICEMTLLYFWSLNNQRIFNFADSSKGIVADHKIRSSTNHYENEYAIRLGVKHLIFDYETPYSYNKITQKKIRFFCVHCQGDAKPGMKYLASRKLKPMYAIVIFIHSKKIKLRTIIKRTFSKFFSSPIPPKSSSIKAK